MARLFTSGFELNSTASRVEWSSATTTNSTIVTSPVRTGTYAGQTVAAATAGTVLFNEVFSATAVDKLFLRVYFRFATITNNNTAILRLGSFSNPCARLVLNTTGTIQLSDEDGNIGSVSSALSANTWYRLEVMFDRTGSAGSHVVEFKLDGSVVATSSTRSLSVGAADFAIGVNNQTNGTTTFTCFWDDVALNDANGSFQNSYPGVGSVLRLRPNAVGDAAGFVRQGVDSGQNFSQVNEVTPDDITAYVNSTTLNAEDLYNMDPSGLSSYDTINVVSANVRYRGNSATLVPSFVMEIEKTSGGTIAQGSAITPTSTTWITDAISGMASPLAPTLVTYLDPDGAAWTNTTLDSMQVGFKLTVDNTNRDDISAVWATVDYVPGSAPLPANANMLLMF